MGAGAMDQVAYLWPLVRDGIGFNAAVAVAVLLGLRLWHLHRAHQKQAKLDAVQADPRS
jgi:cytochrome oxidase assembly protein ShyY1